MRTDLFMIPGPVKEKDLADKTLVMIDVLRASTTICYALNSGARAVIPVEEPGEATDMRTKIGPEWIPTHILIGRILFSPIMCGWSLAMSL